MATCEMCGKKLGMLSSYIHQKPDGSNIEVCSDCDVKIEKNSFEEEEKKLVEKKGNELKKKSEEVKKILSKNSMWEYKVLNLKTVGDVLNATNHKINEKYSEDMNKLGEEGWELVSAVPMTGIAPKIGATATATTWVSCVFKRRK